MDRSLRILVADADPPARTFLQKILTALGHQLVAAVRTGNELLHHCRDLRPDLVIADMSLPEVDGAEAARQLSLAQPLPFILLAPSSDPETVERAWKAGVQALLIKPLRPHDLPPAVMLSMSRFEQIHSLRQENASLRQCLEDRKVIERAKGVIMKRGGLDEAEAYRRLQRLASNRNQKAVEIAQMVLVAEEAITPA